MTVVADKKVARFDVAVNNVFTVEVVDGIRGLAQLNDVNQGALVLQWWASGLGCLIHLPAGYD